MTLDQSMLFVLDRWARNSFWEGAAAKTMVTPPFSLMMRFMARRNISGRSLTHLFPIGKNIQF